MFGTLLGVEHHLVLICDDSSGHGGTVVSSPADEHDSKLRNNCLGLKLEVSLSGESKVSLAILLHFGGLVLITTDDVVALDLHVS